MAKTIEEILFDALVKAQKSLDVGLREMSIGGPLHVREMTFGETEQAAQALFKANRILIDAIALRQAIDEESARRSAAEG